MAWKLAATHSVTARKMQNEERQNKQKCCENWQRFAHTNDAKCRKSE
jgi:hypothetical protein